MILENIEIVFGGGAVGLMGKLADMIIAGGGRIKGIMPKRSVSLIMGPEPDDFHDFFFLQHLINKTVLNVDPSRIGP